MASQAVSLPALTSELLEVPLASWNPLVDPGSLAWQSAVSSNYTSELGAAPPAGDAAWTSTSAVNRAGSGGADWRVQVPVDGLTAGVYGVWVRVAGGPLASPARWAGRLLLR